MRTGWGSRSAATAAAVATVALLLSACGSPSTPPASSTPASSGSATTTGPTASDSTSPSGSATSGTPTPSLSGAATDPVTHPPSGTSASLLTAVRLAGHPGYDRLVFEFRGAVPGYEVKYADGPVIADPSGETVTIAGDHALLIRMEPASGMDLTTTPIVDTYTGPDRVTAKDTTVVREAVLTGDFEAVLNWAVGVDGEPPFVVRTMTGPSRLVIDFATG